MRYFFLSFLVSVQACFALQTLREERGILYEMYKREEEIPEEVLEEGVAMYYEAYLSPKLHEGISLKQLKIDEAKFDSYEAFIYAMFTSDFSSYRFPGEEVPRLFMLARSQRDRKIVGICAILETQPGYFYIDHIGVDKQFRKQSIASNLIELFVNNSNFQTISLDTRIFNIPAQLLYEKLGFEKLTQHPNPSKQNTYFHYLLKRKV